MDSRFKPELIAARLRGLMARDLLNVERIARDLGVSELALRMSVDEVSPHPALEVIVAAVRWYGVDPIWLTTGEYDVDAHRVLLVETEDAEHSVDLASLIARYVPLASSEPPLTA